MVSLFSQTPFRKHVKRARHAAPIRQGRAGGLCEFGFGKPAGDPPEKNRKKRRNRKIKTYRGQVEPVFEDQFQGNDRRFDHEIQKEPGDSVCNNGKSLSEPYGEKNQGGDQKQSRKGRERAEKGSGNFDVMVHG